MVKGDLYRYEGSVKPSDFMHAYRKYEGFRFSFWLRASYCARKKKLSKVFVLPWARMLYHHYRYKYGYDISYGIDIEPGLMLFHFGGVVVTATHIGKNATISHCTTIGMRIVDGEKRFPDIGDDVYIAPGAKIVGDVQIGCNVAVGTNAVVLKSVPDNSVVVGIPGKVISSLGAREYLPNRI